MPIGAFIRQLREEVGLSQAEFADKLGLSRPTVGKLERDEYELTVTEAQKSAELFGLSLEDLLARRRLARPVVDLPKKMFAAKVKKAEESPLRISVPQKKLDVFEGVLLYILNKVGAKPNVGETVLYKLLYFIDFNFYEKYEEQLVGATYIKNTFGPTALEFNALVNKMADEQKLVRVRNKVFDFEQKKYLPVVTPDLSTLDARAVQLIDEVLAKYSDMSARQISDLSHRDVPWLTAEEGKPIEYESVFYRTPEFSVRQYADEL